MDSAKIDVLVFASKEKVKQMEALYTSLTRNVLKMLHIL